ncbi:MAG: SEC-C metal-binding domain-containing protein [Desulfatibacillaceae bacterium]
MKIGRNQPCPCGSGKKYKKCCLNKAATPSHESYYSRLSEAQELLLEKLLDHAVSVFGNDSMNVAMHEFLLWPDSMDEVDDNLFERLFPLFWPWFVFNWEYDEIDAQVELAAPEGRTVAELYAENRGNKLEPLERELIDAVNRVPYSFHEVLSVDEGRGMTLKDILKGTIIDVHERIGSQYVQPGDILYGRAVSVDGVGMIIGLCSTLIPPGRKTEVIQLRKLLRRGGVTVDDYMLHDWDAEIRELYLNIEQSLHAPPRFQNTDDEDMEFHKLVYEVTSADEALEKLADLCATMTLEELRDEAERDENGRIVHAELLWNRLGHKKMTGLPNTTLGNIVLEGGRLTAEVNSAERAKTLRREIDARLGEGGRFKLDEIQDMDKMMSRLEADPDLRTGTTEHEELMQLPEVRDRLREVILQHMEAWVDLKIRALGGKTPREAVKTADGREAVEALLRGMERDRGQDSFTHETTFEGVQRARETLGLKKP